MKTANYNKSIRGFSLVEILVTLAIAATLAAFLVPQLMKSKTSAEDANGESIRSQIQSTYDQWATLGGSHTTATSTDLTLGLLNLLGSTPDDTSSQTPNYVSVAGDPQAIKEQRRSSPLPGTIRTRFAAAPATESINGATEVTYIGKYIVRFVPVSSNSGTWSVIRIQ
jgi:prepilin-type N-terminal cleavage/methylation domain-containing protein